jgi:putative flippase GtrA
MKYSDIRELLAFGVVGTIGFAVDGGVLTILSQHFGVNLYASRGASFAVATLATWLLNRTLVFKAEAPRGSKKREYARYLMSQIGGALVNLGVFSALISSFPSLRAIPILPLAAGSICGMVVNYTGSRFWVFKKTLADGERI